MLHLRENDVSKITGDSKPYALYVPNEGHAGQDHVSSLCEATGLAAVKAPPQTYCLRLPAPLFNPSGKKPAVLSQAQKEAIVYSFQSHAQTFLGVYEKFDLKKLRGKKKREEGFTEEPDLQEVFDEDQPNVEEVSESLSDDEMDIDGEVQERSDQDYSSVEEEEDNMDLGEEEEGVNMNEGDDDAEDVDFNEGEEEDVDLDDAEEEEGEDGSMDEREEEEEDANNDEGDEDEEDVDVRALRWRAQEEQVEGENIDNCLDDGREYKAGEVREYRRGFFLGDGTGTGKTRILAAIVSEYYYVGGRRCLWVTASDGLFDNAINSMDEIFGGEDMAPAILLRRIQLETHRSQREKIEVLLVTYRDLVECDKAKTIEKWLGKSYSGLMLFDEIHLAKSAYLVGHNSECGQRVMRLQFNFPMARVVYCTATAASEVEHLLIYPRLHLWGPGTAYANTDVFKTKLVARGLPGLEMLTMEMKIAGVFLSRQLSFANVLVHQETVKPSEYLQITYGRAAQLFSLLFSYQAKLRKVFCGSRVKEEEGELGAPLCFDLPLPSDGPTKDRGLGQMVAPLYQACQGFFASLITSTKLEKMDILARMMLHNNKSVVIGIQRTGDSKLSNYVEGKPWNKGKPFSNVLAILRTAMCNLGLFPGGPRTYLKDGTEVRIGDWKDVEFVPKHKTDEDNLWEGITLTPEELLSDAGEGFILPDDFPKMDKTRITDVGGWPKYTVGSFIPEVKSPADISWSYDDVSQYPSPDGLIRLYHELSLLLPINPLDEIRNRLENPYRLTLNDARTMGSSQSENASKKYPPETWTTSFKVAELTGRANLYTYNHVEKKWEHEKLSKQTFGKEKDSFMRAEKRVAVISTVASTGIDLHSSNDVHNKEKRVHITVEVGWSPELLLQQLGRTHRANQKHLPRYFILTSSMPGEQRFMASMGRRLKSAGASSTGVSEANPHSACIIDELFSMNSAYAINAALERADGNLEVLLKMLGIKPIAIKFVGNCAMKMVLSRKTKDGISRFLNRLMVMPPKLQNEFFGMIEQELRMRDDYDAACKSLRVLPKNLEDVTLVSQRQLNVDGKAGMLYRFRVERHASWEYMMEVMQRIPNLSFYKSVQGSEVDLIALYSYKVVSYDEDEVKETMLYKAFFPFNRNEELMCPQFDPSYLTPVTVAEMQVLWQEEIQRLLATDRTCSHVSPDDDQCEYDKETKKCTARWHVTECLVITECLTNVAVSLEDVMIPPQIGKVTYQDGGSQKNVVGLLVCCENCIHPISDVFNKLAKSYGTM